MRKPQFPKNAYLGLFYPALEEQLCRAIEQARQTGGPLTPILLLVTTPSLGKYLSRFLGRRFLRLGNIRITTLSELASSVYLAALEAPAYRLEHPLEEFLLRWLVQRYSTDSQLGEIERLAGFARALAATIGEVKRANLSPQEWDELQIIDSSAGLSGGKELPELAGGQKWREIGRLYRAYQEELRRADVYDEADLLRNTIGLLPQSPYLQPYPILCLYGFYRLCPLERQWLSALFAQRECAAFVPWSENPCFAPVKPLLHWLAGEGFSLTPVSSTASCVAADLEELRRDLYQPRLDQPEHPVTAVSLICASTETQEAEEIAREIFQLARQGFSFGEMAIALRQEEPYARVLRDVLGERGIPFYGSGGSLAEGNAAGGLRLLISAVAAELDGEAIMRLARWPQVDYHRLLPAALWPGARPEEWLWLTRRFSLSGKPDHWLPWLQRAATVSPFLWQPAETQEEMLSPRKKRELLSHLEGSSSGGEENWSLLCQALSAFVQRLQEELTGIAGEPTWTGLAVRFAKLAEAFFLPTDGQREVLAALLSLKILDRFGLPVSLKTFAEAAETVLQRLPRTQGQWGAGVTMAPLENFLGIGFSAVILPGLVETYFPTPLCQDPILADAQRLRLNQILSKRRSDTELEIKGRHLSEEYLLFHLAVACARARLVLTFARFQTLEENPRLPSPLLIHLLEALSHQYLTLDSLLKRPEIRYVSGMGDHLARATCDREYGLILAQRGKHGERASFSFLRTRYPLWAVAQENLAARWRQPGFTSFDGVLASTASRQILQAHHALAPLLSVSPAQLETYALCPFRYFLRYVLALESWSAPARQPYTLSALHRRQLLLRIVQSFFRQLEQSQILPLVMEHAPRYRALLHEKTDEAFQNWEKQGNAPLPGVWPIEKEILRDEVNQFLERELAHARHPVHFQVTYGMPETGAGLPKTQAVVIELDETHRLHFCGEIDRVDLEPTTAHSFAVTYRTGREPTRLADDHFHGGENLQQAIQLLALENFLPTTQAMASENYYMTEQGEYARLSFTKEHWPEKMEHLRQICHYVAEGIENGFFFPFPEENKCRLCPYLKPCGPARFQVYEQKQDDPRIAFFQRLKEIP